VAGREVAGLFCLCLPLDKFQHVDVLKKDFSSDYGFSSGSGMVTRNSEGVLNKGMSRQMVRGGSGKWRVAVMLAGLVLLAGHAWGASSQGGADKPSATLRPLQFGLLPYLSTRKLFTYYAPLQHYLEKQLGRPVRMSTAPDFFTYIQRAREGQYDLYHTAPHFAAQAEAEFGYRRVSRLMRELDGSIVVARSSNIHSADDLRGRTMITPDTLAIITFLGEQWLRDNGLRPGVDIEVKHAPSHNSAIRAVARGDVEAAVTSTSAFENMPQKISSRLRILASTKKVPHMMFMAGPHLSDQEYQQLRKAVLAFTAKGAGKNYFSITGHGDMGPIRDQDMQRLLPFLKELNVKLRGLSKKQHDAELRH
jgi:phosphonate transport system substrate-binding protein